VRIFVENSGAPIPAEDHSRIFEPFYTTKEPGEGSGLGLAIVSATVADHGADIAVYDSPLGGAGFGITFRRAAEEAESI
jgi:signal transduction histidine kinase